MISNVLAFIFKCIALTRLYPQANALQVGFVLDCKMVLHWPELTRRLDYELSVFYICHFGGWEFWHLAVRVSSRQPCQQAPRAFSNSKGLQLCCYLLWGDEPT